MTRARDRLLLFGGITPKQFETRWSEDCEATTTALLQARSYADWLAMWFAKNCAETAEARNQGETSYFRWRLHDDTSLTEATDAAGKVKNKAIVQLDKPESARLLQRLSVSYPFGEATNQPAKTSVSVLRRRALEFLEQEESAEFFNFRRTTRGRSNEKKSSASIGTAHHRFLEHVSFHRMNGLTDLRAEAERLVNEGVLTNSEAQRLNFNSLLQFWRSDFGRKILSNAEHVRRELAFTAPDPKTRDLKKLHSEFVIVQGVADVAVIQPKEMWLLDFKTDDVALDELNRKIQIYAPQLKLYALALERIYHRPVTDCRIHFLAPGITTPLPLPSTREAIDPAPTA
jgi:ATP-dependent helicase/nuclease subunit A